MFLNKKQCFSTKKKPLARLQFADKGVSTVILMKSFRPPFSKGGAVEAA